MQYVLLKEIQQLIGCFQNTVKKFWINMERKSD